MNATRISTIRPGLLVSLRTNLSGNVRYTAQEIEADHVDPDTGARRARWETERVIADPVEHEAAVKARGKARSLITATCAQSAFGLLCPEADEDKLHEAIREARTVADTFNEGANLTHIAVNVIVGRIAADDVEAVRAINSEVRELLSQMERGIRNTDATVIREAANKARGLAAMLSPEAAKRAQIAIEAARIAARQITKAGETAALEVDAVALETVRNSRLSFLDYSDEGTDVETPLPVGVAIDFETSSISQSSTPGSLFADIEF